MKLLISMVILLGGCFGDRPDPPSTVACVQLPDTVDARFGPLRLRVAYATLDFETIDDVPVQGRDICFTLRMPRAPERIDAESQLQLGIDVLGGGGRPGGTTLFLPAVPITLVVYRDGDGDGALDTAPLEGPVSDEVLATSFGSFPKLYWFMGYSILISVASQPEIEEFQPFLADGQAFIRIDSSLQTWNTPLSLTAEPIRGCWTRAWGRCFSLYHLNDIHFATWTDPRVPRHHLARRPTGTRPSPAALAEPRGCVQFGNYLLAWHAVTRSPVLDEIGCQCITNEFFSWYVFLADDPPLALVCPEDTGVFTPEQAAELAKLDVSAIEREQPWPRPRAGVE